jgi:hypothetical protein
MLTSQGYITHMPIFIWKHRQQRVGNECTFPHASITSAIGKFPKNNYSTSKILGMMQRSQHHTVITLAHTGKFHTSGRCAPKGTSQALFLHSQAITDSKITCTTCANPHSNKDCTRRQVPNIHDVHSPAHHFIKHSQATYSTSSAVLHNK